MAKTQTVRRIGIHTSSAGALYNAATKAIELGADCFQIFSGSPRAGHNLTPLVTHANYLINLCSPDAANRPKSITAFRGDLALTKTRLSKQD